MNKNLKHIILILGLLLLSFSAFSQKEGARWYFGENAGLDFKQHSPVTKTDGKTNAREGVATISTPKGDLLFYTDGSTIWNKDHQPMQNGYGLKGNTSSSQSSIIVPQPGKPSLYYVFTVDVIDDKGTPGEGLNYSVVDMSKGGNRLGLVTQEKNISLLSTCVEKITAVLEKETKEYWIIAHGWDNNEFYLYKLTKNGLKTPDQEIHKQNVGSIHPFIQGDQKNSGAIGYMKSSPQGDFIALAIEGTGDFEIFNFDNHTGQIEFLATLPATNPIHGEPNLAAYGVEFSPTSNYLYGTTRRGGKIYRWSLDEDALNEESIKNSVEILNPEMSGVLVGAIQLAFNGKLYIAFSGKRYLGVIDSPTQPDCKFEQYGVSLIDNTEGEEGKGGKAFFGLPTFLPDFFMAAEFYYENTCVNDETLFYLSTTGGFKEGEPIYWNIFDDDGEFVAEVIADEETKQGYYTFTEPGKYLVELKAIQFEVPVENNKLEITINPIPVINWEDETLLCATKSVTLNAGDGAFYYWGSSSNWLDRELVVNKPGTYTVEVRHNNGCTNSDTTEVVEYPLPNFSDVIESPATCQENNGSIEIITELDISNYIFDWGEEYKEFENSNKLVGLGKGIYYVQLIDKETLCSRTITATISETDAPPVDIISSTNEIICPGTEVILEATGAGNYRWTIPNEDGTSESESRIIKVNPYKTTVYVLEGYNIDPVTFKECGDFKTITIEVYPYYPPELGNPQEGCEGNPISLVGGADYSDWQWSTGDSGQFIEITETQDPLWIKVLDEFGCWLTDTTSITINPLPKIDLVKDQAICEGTELILDPGEADSYLWNTNDTTRLLTIYSTNYYEVTAIAKGCENSNGVYIQVNSPDSLRIDSVNVRDVTCFGANNGKILVFASGEGNTYEYSADNGTTWEANYGLFDPIDPGENYTVQVREDSACISTWKEYISVHQPAELIVDYQLVSPSCDVCQDGRITLNVIGGTPPYDYIWSNFETGKTRFELGLGSYSVSVSDAAYCKGLTTILLDMGHGSVSIPNAITPNADGANDYWIIKALENYPDAIVTVFDRSGKVVFESSAGYPEAWDGRYNNEYLPMGTYYYVIKLNEFLDLVNGSLTIIR